MDYSELKARLLNRVKYGWEGGRQVRTGDPLCEEAAEAITTLEARIAQLEADRAQWVELPRLTMGKQE